MSLARFQVLPATHSYLAKFYGLCLFAAFIGLLAFNAQEWTIWSLAAVGLLANTEILVMLACSKEAPVDMPHLFAFLKSR